MKPFYQDNHNTIYCLDFRENDLPDESVQMVCTSPPYWGLRKYSGEQELIWGGDNACEHEWAGIGLISDRRGVETIQGKSRTTTRCYGGDSTRTWSEEHQKHWQDTFCSLCGAWKGAYGLEPTPEMYVQHTIEILREIRRVLRKDGVVFWNIGDSYASSTKGDNRTPEELGKSDRLNRAKDPNKSHVFIPKAQGKWSVDLGKTLKPKDLCLIPFRVAIAAQEDGWWARSVIIWSKPNPMPESVTDRPTESHEYILMLTKNSRYYWDANAVRELNTQGTLDRLQSGKVQSSGKNPKNIEAGRWAGQEDYVEPAGRNIRTVWEFPTQPYPEAHFAVFPEKLPELCIKAATPEVGCCAKCGAPWTRLLSKGFTEHDGQSKTAYTNEGGHNANQLAKLRQAARERGGEYKNTKQTIGWQPTCKCNTIKPPVPSLVLDPFSGAGTTLYVAKKLNRYAVGYDISEEYCQLAVERCRQQVIL